MAVHRRVSFFLQRSHQWWGHILKVNTLGFTCQSILQKNLLNIRMGAALVSAAADGILDSVSFSSNERQNTKLHRHPSPSCVECVALGGSLAPLKVQVSRPCWGASFCRGGSTPIDEPGLVFAQSCGAFFRNSFDSRTGWSRHCDDITIIVKVILRSISLRCSRNLFTEPL